MEERDVHDLVTADEDLTIGDNVADGSSAKPKTDPAQPASSLQAGSGLQFWLDKTLNFLANASNETLGYCAVGLGASTYIALGRVGLVLIGVVGGIALHASWERQSSGAQGPESESIKRRELALEIVQRLLRWRSQQIRKAAESGDVESEDEQLDVKLYESKNLDFSSFQPETAAALDTFTTAIIRDYVRWWYSPVLPGEDVFPQASRQTLTAFLLKMSNHISRKRPTDVFVDFSINASSIVIAFFAEFSAALGASPHSNAATAIETYIELKPDSSLAQMLDSDAQRRKLDIVAEDILQSFLETPALDFAPAHIFLQRTLSRLILGMTLDTCSKPEWINGWIVYLLEEGEPEILQALDASIDEADTKKAGTEAPQSPRSPDTQTNRSRAEDAMDEALQEAKRLTQLIMEEEARKAASRVDPVVSSSDVSEDAAQGIHTPTSSQSESEKPLPVQPEIESQPSITVSEEPEAQWPRSSTVDQVGQATGEEVSQSPRHSTSFEEGLAPITPSTSVSDPKPVLTLHNAKISIFDDSMPGQKTTMKSKPTIDYLIQIEPADSRFSGWMIAKKFTDFETLHEVLRRIAVITGAAFKETHATLPNWKTLKTPEFRQDLESYLADALKYQQLAECEGMKRFLEKDQGLLKSPSASKGLGWVDPLQMGKGMVDALTKGPRDVATGKKTLFGGVLGGGKKSATASPLSATPTSPTSAASPATQDDYVPMRSSISLTARSSTDTFQHPLSAVTNNDSQDSLPSRPGSSREARELPVSRGTSLPSTGRPSVEAPVTTAPIVTHSREDSTTQALNLLDLPPPPSAMDDLGMPIEQAGKPIEPAAQQPISALPKSPTKSRPKSPMTAQETIVTVDLLFAVISELYTLSSAWNFRRTLLQAARTYLLRPGNPQLESIRVLIEESVIDANASDAGVASMILKTRENSLPTAEELKKWPAPPTAEEKEALRIKARKLLVERGMPQALNSVMGAAASGEALGKVFDCLQEERVARGMLFGLMVQALRAVVQ